ncbi:MAG: sugar ABC transporter ATP-binding protein [Chloroflexi bacterium]|nr:sugar ABC transporter ATP-binding protein [Chloroflexota bacterium]
MSQSTQPEVSLAAQHLVKRYGGVTALADGRLSVGAGDVLALLGANGSGKSTLTKIVTGVVAPDAGQILLDDQPVHFPSPQAARKLGIAAVYQELSLIPDLSVAENIWLAHEPLNRGFVRQREVRERTASLLDLFDGTVSARLQPDTTIAALPPDEKQIVEILKAISLDPRVLILDEATASLDARQVTRLFDLIDRWRARGKALVFVSHRMEEIFRVATRATVLRSGQSVADVSIAGTSAEKLVGLMIEGTTASAQLRHDEIVQPDAPVRIAATNLHTRTVRGLDLTLRQGELLGLGGLQGQGQTDLLLALFGATPFSGTLTLDGQAVHFKHPRQAIRAGVAFVPGDRGAEGLLSVRSILENAQLPSWRRYGPILNLRRAREDALEIAQSLKLKMASLDAPVSSLSGGNAQKVVLGKWLLRQPQVLLLNDPTKGVDVGAKGDFYAILRDLRAAGMAIVLYSSDDEELLGLCDRVLVMRDGMISAELAGPTLTRDRLVAASMSVSGGSHD